MPLNGQKVDYLWATDSNGSNSVSITHNFGPSYVVGKPLIQAYTERQDQAGINTFVAQYVQAGTPQNGDWPMVWGDNFTSITYYLTVVNAYGRIIWETDFW